MARISIEHELARKSLEQQTRRYFLGESATGLGALWFAGAQQSASAAAATSGTNADSGGSEGITPHWVPRAKRVIFLHMVGGPSQLELFDCKPQLTRFNGKPCPKEFIESQNFPFIRGIPDMMGPQFPFAQHGESGAWVTDRLPHFSEVVDDVCFIKTLQTDQFNHGPAQLMVHCGQPRIGAPSIGSWVTWGLGSENDRLPGYIVLLSGGRPPRVGKSLWGAGFLPSVYQGIQCRSSGDPVLNVSNPQGVTRDARRLALDSLRRLNERNYELFGDPETQTRIAQYEMSFRMQETVPEAMDLSDEPEHIHKLYGTENGKVSLANNCLLARRLVERGVRYVQVFDWGWDSHGSSEQQSINVGFPEKCRETDRPMTALLSDLKQRGLLEDTLLIWTGEFGRTPMQESRKGERKFVGRDHNPHAFTVWMAGGGVKRGMSYGETDDMGYTAAVNPVPLRDFHATLLHLLGIDHTRLTVPFQGLNQKLTSVLPARVIDEVIA
ncbi:MAG: DUF1501 domain-containing protein [Planctomycetaceae bacterium]